MHNANEVASAEGGLGTYGAQSDALLQAPWCGSVI